MVVSWEVPHCYVGVFSSNLHLSVGITGGLVAGLILLAG